jgi:hypothetical protein
MADPKYMDGVFICKKEFSNGGHVIKMDINPDRLIEWLKNAPRTEKGYVKTQIQSKREPEKDDYGNVKMFCALDSYFYKDQATPQPLPPQPSQQQAPPQNGGYAQTFDTPGDDSDIPFSPCVI